MIVRSAIRRTVVVGIHFLSLISDKRCTAGMRQHIPIVHKWAPRPPTIYLMLHDVALRANRMGIHKFLQKYPKRLATLREDPIRAY